METDGQQNGTDGQQPISEKTAGPGEFPTDALSPLVRDLVMEISQVYQIPPQMPAMAALAVTGAAVGKRYILVEAVNGQESFANLYVVATASRGGGKGSVGNVIVEPLFEADRAMHTRFEPTKITRESEAEMLRAQIQALGRRAPKVSMGEEVELRQEIERKKARLEEVQPGGSPVQAPSLVVGNCTSEALAIAAALGDQAVLSYSAEAGELLRVTLGKYNKSNQGDIDLFLSGYSSEHVNYNRVGRAKLQLRPTLSTLWFVQPFIMEEVLNNPEVGERGFTARMLIVNSQIELKHDDGVPRSINVEVRRRWQGYIEHLAQPRPTMCSHEVHCSAEARERFRIFYNRAIDQRKGDCADVEGELSRWRENAIRVALNLWLADGAGADLTAGQAERAIRIVTWCGRSYLEMLNQERRARKTARVERLRALLLDTNHKEITLRALKNSHAFNHTEVRSLASEFPEKLQIIEKVHGASGGRPSEVLSIPSASY
jgi:hypothetical protein